MIFVFATHADQLNHTIRTVYGNDFDALKYLYRFFDRTYQFDEPSLREFIESRWQDMGFQEGRFLVFHGIKHQEYIESISLSKNLSLRDIDQCMDIMWSVSEFSDSRVKIPLMFLYPLIVAYHLREMAAFEEATGEVSKVSRSAPPTEYQKFFDGTVIFSRKQFNVDWNREEYSNVTLRDFMDTFRRLLSSGLLEFSPSQNMASEYVERYRDMEMENIHSNRLSHGKRTPSILEAYGSLIRRAGRVTPIIGSSNGALKMGAKYLKEISERPIG